MPRVNIEQHNNTNETPVYRRIVCASSLGIRFCCLLVFAVILVFHRDAV